MRTAKVEVKKGNGHGKAKTVTKAPADELRIEYMPLAEVKRWPRNPKTHDLDSLGESMDRFGFVMPMLRDDKTGKLVAGHGRLERLQKMKAAGEAAPKRVIVRGSEWYVPVICGVRFKDPREAEAYLLADNRQVERGGWDVGGLAVILKDFMAQGEDALRGIGWTNREAEALLREADPSRAVGPAPASKLDAFMSGEIKQIVLYFDAEQYDLVVSRLQRVMEEGTFASHTETFLALLVHYEKTSKRARA
jgi:hypothetical protein